MVRIRPYRQRQTETGRHTETGRKAQTDRQAGRDKTETGTHTHTHIHKLKPSTEIGSRGAKASLTQANNVT